MQTLSLVKVLRSCGLSVVVLCYFEHHTTIVREFQKTGAKVNLLDMNRHSGIFKLIIRLRKEIKKIKPDIVHVQYMAPGALPIIAARFAGVKVVIATVHQPWTPSHGMFSKIILRLVSLLCTRFIAVSVNAENSWFGSGQLFNVNKPVNIQPRHFTIYNSVDTERIQRIATAVNVDILKQSLCIPIGITLIGAVSRLRHEKGIDLLIKAFNRLVKAGTPIHLLIVGTGPDEEELNEMAQVQGISSYITFYGEADWETAMKLMALMDIVAVPSRFEGFGLTATEAMAVAKPVVASACQGLKEIVENRHTGLLFKTEDWISLSDSISVLLKDETLKREIGENGRKKVVTHFSNEQFISRIKGLYSIFND